MFIDGPEFVLVHAQLDTEGNIPVKFQTNPTSYLGGESIKRMFPDGHLDRQTDAGEFPDRKKSSSELHEELIISNRTLKMALKFR